MKIATWNSCGGELFARDSDLRHFAADIVVVQECLSPPNAQSEQHRWFGKGSSRGVGVVARPPYSLESILPGEQGSGSVFPVRVRGPLTFNLLAVWAKPDPSYVLAALNGILQHEELFAESPTVAIGDFNSHWRWDPTEVVNHSHLVGKLDELGLVSAYHAYRGGCEPGDEIPTLYWRWQESSQYHIDYCFLPKAWVPNLKSVVVGNYEDWAAHSDHRPLIVDVLNPVQP